MCRQDTEHLNITSAVSIDAVAYVGMLYIACYGLHHCDHVTVAALMPCYSQCCP